MNKKWTKKFYILTSSRVKRGDRKILLLLRHFIHRNDEVYYRKAFTLAEVLITLLIIGVVASLIVPNLINDAQDAELRTAWKKTYSDISQAAQRIMMDNGGTIYGLCSDLDNNCFRYALENYMSYTKDCIPGKSEGNCWTTWGSDLGAFILSNGSFLKVEWGLSSCINNTWHGTLPKCAMIWVDINGFKGPNWWGKDMYAIQIQQNTIKPLGSPGDGWNICTPSTNSSLGYGCSAKYLYQ